MAWGIPWVSWGLLSWLCALPGPRVPPAPLLAGQWEEQKRPRHCASTAEHQVEPRVWYPRCFGHKSNTWHHTSCFEENELCPSQKQQLPKLRNAITIWVSNQLS